MNAAPPPLRFFLDEGVPDSVGRVLREGGHEVIVLREAMARGAPDVLVCAVAEANDAILVALDGDMREIARSHGVSKGRFRRLSLVKLSCPEPQAAARIREALSLIEHEWAVSQTKAARRLFVEIGAHVMRSWR